MKPFAPAEERAERQELIRLLRETPPEHIAAAGEADTLAAFHRVAETVPFYAGLLQEHNIDPASIETIQQFRDRVPLLDKHNTFGAHPIHELCVNGDLEGVRTVLTSSGHSGVFSFGVNTEQNLQRSARSIDTGLQYLFNVDELSTLLINCLPMGVKVHTHATFLAETSVREDMVFAVIKKFAAEFDQILLVGEGSFLKKIIEEGREEHGIEWQNMRVHLVTGEEGIAENYRTYIGGLLGVTDFDDPEANLVGSSMGVAELDLNIFHETRETIRMRRLAHHDAQVRHALFGDQTRACPMLFVYYPHRCYLEEVPADEHYNELVISMLSPEMKLPLLRYRAGDYARVMTHEEVVQTLESFGSAIVADLKLPFVGVYGRGKSLDTEQGALFPEEVKEALYHEGEIAAAVTGNFRLSRDGGTARLDIQLRKGKSAPAAGDDRLLDALREYSNVQPTVHFHRYDQFPYAMEVDYERKFSYL